MMVWIDFHSLKFEKDIRLPVVGSFSEFKTLTGCRSFRHSVKENFDLHALHIAYVHLTLDVKEVPFFCYEKGF